jgi:hypothetical protein
MNDETREQLDTDALSAWQEEKGANIHTWTTGDNDDEARYWRSIWLKGAAHQHSIAFEQGKKEGWNEAVALCLDQIRACIGMRPFSPEDFEELKRDIEKCSPKN